MKNLFIVLLVILNSFAYDLDEASMKKLIGKMLVVGFENSVVDDSSQIIKDIKKYNLGGVILFDRFYTNREKVKNIANPKQLRILTSTLQKASKNKLIISIDQEGGKVQRLKEKYGFQTTPSAKKIGNLKIKEASQEYKKLAIQLKESGINTNFAPSVDLSVNKKNRVIYQLERSYGSDSKIVSQYAKTFMNELKKQGVLSVLKHFPGHGSSLGDSHEGFVDITNTWNKKELEPYKELIDSNSVEMIMTAHVFNKNLDKKYPATLSYNINTKLLKEGLKFKGLIISDDLQMSAISKHYNLNEVVRLAINSGVDILLFGNQLAFYKTKTIIDTIYDEVKKGNISYEKILEANKKIDAIKF